MNMSSDDATARVPDGWWVPARELFIDTAQRVADGPIQCFNDSQHHRNLQNG